MPIIGTLEKVGPYLEKLFRRAKNKYDRQIPCVIEASLSSWIRVETYDEIFAGGGRDWISRHDKGIMTWNDMSRAFRQCLQPLESTQHRPDVRNNWVRRHFFKIVVHMACVAREDHPTTARPHANALNAQRNRTLSANPRR